MTSKAVLIGSATDKVTKSSIASLSETVENYEDTINELKSSLSTIQEEVIKLQEQVATGGGSAADEVEVADTEVVETMTKYGLYDFLSEVNTQDTHIMVNDMVLKTYSDGSMRFYANLQIRPNGSIAATDSVDVILFDGITSTTKIDLKKQWQNGSDTIVYMDSDGVHFTNAGHAFAELTELTVACYLDEAAASTVTISDGYTATETSDALSDPIAANLTYDLTLQSTVNSNTSQMGFTKLNLTMRNYDKGWLKLDYAGVFVDPNGSSTGEMRIVITSSTISSTAIIEPSPASSTYENWMFLIYPTRGLVASNPDGAVAMGTEFSGSLILLAPYGATFTLDTANIVSNGLAAKTVVKSFKNDQVNGRLSLSNTETGVNVKLEFSPTGENNIGADTVMNAIPAEQIPDPFPREEGSVVQVAYPTVRLLPITMTGNDLTNNDTRQELLLYSDGSTRLGIIATNGLCYLLMQTNEATFAPNTYYCFSGEIPNAFVNLSALRAQVKKN